jgi:hypothetical protein
MAGRALHDDVVVLDLELEECVGRPLDEPHEAARAHARSGAGADWARRCTVPQAVDTRAHFFMFRTSWPLTRSSCVL